MLLCYLVTGLTLCFVLSEYLAKKNIPWQRSLWVGSAVFIGLMLALVQILPTLEMATHASRVAGWRSLLVERSLPFMGLCDLVLPGQLAPPADIHVGTGTRPSFLSLALYPASRSPEIASNVFNHTETAIGFGIWPLLFVLASLPMCFRKIDEGRPRLVLCFLWAASIVGFLGAMAVPGILDLLLLLPGFAVGDVKRLLILPAICMPLLAGLGYRDLAAADLKKILIPGALFLIAGVSVLLMSNAGFASSFDAWIHAKYGLAKGAFVANVAAGEIEQNRWLLGRGLVCAGLALSLAPLFLRRARLAPFAFLLATAIELLPVAWNGIPTPQIGSLGSANEALPVAPEHGGARSRLLRVEVGKSAPSDLNLLPTNMALLWNYAEAGGYAPLAPMRTEAFFETLEPASSSQGAGVAGIQKVETLASPLFELLAVDHVLGKGLELGDEWRRVGNSEYLWERKEKARRARLYFSWRVLPADAISTALESDGFDPLHELLLEEDPGIEAQGRDEQATVEIRDFEPGRIRLSTKSQKPALLFLSEAWAAGWKYRIDGGNRADCLVAQGMFQAIPLPKGSHELLLSYEPGPFRIGAWISFFAFLLCFVTFLKAKVTKAVPVSENT